MRAYEFINEQVATLAAEPVKSTIKDIAKNLGGKTVTGVDKGLNAISYASGAGVIGDQSAGNFVGDQVKMRNAGIGLQIAAKGAEKIAPIVGKTLSGLGTIAKTGTGLVGTAATLGLRHGDAGSAYGPYADTVSGRNDWMTKHGYDPNKPGDYQRAEQDYKTAKSNYTKNASWGEIANRVLNPFEPALPNDDEIMASRKPNIK